MAKPKEFTEEQRGALNEMIRDIVGQTFAEIKDPLMAAIKGCMKMALAEFIRERMEMDEFIRKQTDKKLN